MLVVSRLIPKGDKYFGDRTPLLADHAHAVDQHMQCT